MEHSKRKHSRLAPSKAAVWTVCTASVQLIDANEGRIKEAPSKYAQEGTAAHEVVDCLMRGERVPRGATSEMLDHGKAYVHFCRGLHPDGQVVPEGVEKEVPLFYLPGENGHVDYYLRTEQRVHVVDYKYGAGVKVNALENKQMAVYAMSAIKQFDPHFRGQVSMHIYQPRTREAALNGPVSTWTVTYDELDLFCESKIASKAEIILQNATHLLEYRPSDETCRWCPVQEFCTARAEFLLGGAPVVRKLVTTQTTPPAAESLSDEEIEAMLPHIDGVIDWLGTVRKYAYNRAMEGRPFAGTKLIYGKGTRMWSMPEDKVARMLKSAGVQPYKTPEIISPYAAEQAGVDKDTVDLCSTRVPGAPKLVSIDTKGTEYVPLRIEDEFEPVITEDDLF